jgi:hypothetical protein
MNPQPAQAVFIIGSQFLPEGRGIISFSPSQLKEIRNTPLRPLRL